MKESRILIEKKYLLSDSSEEYTPLSSFRFSDTVRFRWSTDGTDRADTAVLRIHRDSDGEMMLYPMASDGEGRVFTCEVNMRALCADENGGLFYYCADVYFPEGCVTFGGEEPDRLLPVGEEEKRQLLVCRDDFHTPEWMYGGIIYHIFVDRFCSGKKIPPKRGAVLNPDWNGRITQFPEYPGADVANNEFFGGDLYGVADKLDYIASLGVSCIYLSPVFDSASNHKYDTGDYSHVDSMFGGDEALAHLIREAGKRNIRVILDGVFNHTGADSIYFNQMGHYPSTGAVQSKQSPYYPWYTFTSYPDKYDCWWGIRILPKVRCDEPTYRDYILGDNGIIAKWMHMGVAGWRLDVADELSDGFLDALRVRVRKENPEAVIYGEVWENASNKTAYGRRRRYLCGSQLDSVMNYPLKNAVIAYIRDGDAEALRECVHTVYRQYPREAANVLMNFLGTHDTARILTELGGQSAEGCTIAQLSAMRMSEEERRLAAARLRIAYQLIAFMPGMPCIFYGDEAGMEGYGDPFCRGTFPWGREDTALQAFYRETGAFHRAHPVFRDGYVRLLCVTESAAAVLRWNGKDTPVLLLLNRSDAAVTFRMDGEVQAADHSGGRSEAELPPMSGAYYLAPHDEIHVSINKNERISE